MSGLAPVSRIGTSVVGYLPPNGGALYFQVQKAAGSVGITAANMTAGTTYTINTTCSIFWWDAAGFYSLPAARVAGQ